MGNAPSGDNMSRKSLDISRFDSDESLHSQSGTLTTATATGNNDNDGDDQSSHLEIEYVSNCYDTEDSRGMDNDQYKTSVVKAGKTETETPTTEMGELELHLACAPSTMTKTNTNDNLVEKSDGRRSRRSKLSNVSNVSNVSKVRKNKKMDNNNKLNNKENKIRKAIIISFKDVDVNGSHICTVDINESNVNLLFLGSYDPLSWVITGKQINNIDQVVIRETLSTARLADDKIPQWYVDGIDSKKCQINKDCHSGFYQRLTQSQQSAKELIEELENEYNCQIIRIAGGYKAPLEPIDL